MSELLEADTKMTHVGVELEHERGAFMSVYTGGKFYPCDPYAEDVHIEDIAHALSHQNRFNGHLRWPYTVAQHSVLVLREVKRLGGDDNAQKFALLHDAAEAYLGDVIRPVKVYLTVFKEIETKIMNAIAERFGFKMTKDAERLVKTADNIMCAAEKRDLHPTKIEWPGMPDPVDVPTIRPWDHSYAKGAFIRKFNELF